MMTTATMEKEILHKMIDELPQFQDEDDEPLSDDEIAQIDAARARIAAGEFVAWEELEKELAELP